MKNIALITGASSGIGAALAEEHAKRNGDCILVARRKDLLEELQKNLVNKYGISVKILIKDLTNRNEVQDLYDEMIQNGYNISVLINNAGFGGYGKFYERKLKTDLAMIDLNVSALTHLTHLFLSEMVKKKNGKIINVASTASFMPGPLQATYFATKAFVRSFSYALTEELKGTNVTVTTLCPGPTRTEFEKRSNMNGSKLFKKAKTAQQVAVAGYKAMEKGKRMIITDRQQAFLIALMPFFPVSMVLKITRKLQEK